MDETLKQFLKVFEGLPTREEFLTAFKNVVERFKKLETKLTSDFQTLVTTITDRVDTAIAGIHQGVDGKDGEPGKDGKDGRDGVDGTNGAPGVDGTNGTAGKDGSPDTGDEIIAKINAAEHLIAKEAVMGFDELEKKIEDVRQAAATRVQTPAKAFMIHTKDASSQCNGVNKTFSVGGTHFGIVGVFCTSFPTIYRPIIDYTETATGILLTDAVEAPEQDQTMVIQFLK